MIIETIAVSPFETNCFLVAQDVGQSCVIIDPGDEDEKIIEYIDKNKLTPSAILLTHGHGDHIGAVEPMRKKYNIPVYVGKGDEPLLASPSANMSAIFGHSIECSPAEHIVSDSDVIKIKDLEFVVFATPGHSPGGVCYYIGNRLFCGDTLFCGSVGRTDLPGGSHSQLIGSIQKSILSLPDDTICYPGHGPATTVGEERRDNPFLTGQMFV